MYKIIDAATAAVLTKRVNKATNGEWREAGGVSIDCNGHLLQALVRVKRKYKMLEAGNIASLIYLLNKKKHWTPVGGMTVESCDGGYMYAQLIVKEI